MEDPIVLENLTKDYGNNFKAVDALNLKVKRNSFVGFLGPNGAGKTTTIKMLTNLLTITSGKAYLNGVDVVSDPKNALSDIGAVVETPEFYPFLTPMETFEYLGSLRGMSKEDIAQAKQGCARAGEDDRMVCHPHRQVLQRNETEDSAGTGIASRAERDHP